VERVDAKFSCDGDKIGLMGLQEPQQRSEKQRIRRSAFQLIRPNSGQIDEPLRPPVATKRCR
jgi:hypothetical protein